MRPTRVSLMALLAVVLATSVTAVAAGEEARAAGQHKWTRQFGTDAYEVGRGVAVHTTGVYVVGYTSGTLPGQVSLGGFDAFVRAYDAAGRLLWTRQFGSNGEDYAWRVAVNGEGVYVTGSTSGTLSSQTHQGGDDVFVRKYDHTGKHKWTRQFGTTADDRGRGVAVDASGVYVVGYTGGALPGQANQGDDDVFIRKFDHAGRHKWVRQFGTSAGDSGTSVAVNASGVYVAGTIRAALPGQTHKGGSDGFVRAYDATGAHRWTRQFGTAMGELGEGVAADASGVYVAGSTDGAMPGQTNSGGWDGFVRAYDAAGKHRWTRQFGTGEWEEAKGIAAGAGGVYVVGYTNGVMPGCANRGESDAFMRAYDAVGKHRWTRQFGTTKWDEGLAVAASGSGVFATGYAWSAFPGQTHSGGSDVYVRKHATS